MGVKSVLFCIAPRGVISTDRLVENCNRCARCDRLDHIAENIAEGYRIGRFANVIITSVHRTSNEQRIKARVKIYQK